jgi:hypothetical protein
MTHPTLYPAEACCRPSVVGLKRERDHLRMNHEEAFIRGFIVADKQERYLWLLASSNRRSGFLDRLNHHLDYDPALATHVPAGEQTASGIGRLLRQRGAPDLCHTISCHEAWDARVLPLPEALDLIIGFSMGTVLCCIPGKLAYYEAEGLRQRYILSK